MSSPINLNRARKERARQEKRQKAQENAVSFGRTKQEKEAEKKQRESLRSRLDAHKMRPDD